MDFKGKRVLVLDGYGRQIPSILEQLHKLGCIITTLNSSKLDVGYTSRYPRKKIVNPKAKNDIDELKCVLDKEIFSGNYDVVFPMLEPSTELLVKNALCYEKFVKIVAAPCDAFLKAYDKQETMIACMDNNIPCTITKRDEETLEEFIIKVGYPLAVKPRRGTGSVGFHCIETPQQMSALLDSGFVVEENIVQEYIPQTDTQYIGFIMLDGNGDLKSAVIADKHRWYPVDGGAACYVQTIHRPDLVDNAVKLLQAIGWKGFAHLDFIGDPRNGGIAKVMEINGRIPASIKMCACVDIPIVKQELQYAYGMAVDEYLDDVPTGVGLRYFQTDFLWFLKSPNRFKANPSWFNFSKSKDFIWSMRDPFPFFSYTISHILTLKSDMKKRKRDI